MLHTFDAWLFCGHREARSSNKERHKESLIAKLRHLTYVVWTNNEIYYDQQH